MAVTGHSAGVTCATLIGRSAIANVSNAAVEGDAAVRGAPRAMPDAHTDGDHPVMPKRVRGVARAESIWDTQVSRRLRVHAAV